METQTSPSETHKYAGVFTRYVALLIDGFVVSLFSNSINFVSSTSSGDKFNFSVTGFSFFLSAAYYIFMIATQDGQTLGKRLMGIRVIRQDGHKIDYSTAILRFIGSLISAAVFGFGYLAALFNNQKLTWHDRIAKTYVIRIDDKKRTGIKILATLFITSIFLFFLAIFGIALFAATKATPEVRKDLIKELKNIEKEINDSQSFTETSLEDTFNPGDIEKPLFVMINNDRLGKNLPAFKEDQKLCAYAQKRLQDIRDNQSRYDDSRGFIEDTHNNQMIKTYFSNFSGANELYYSGNISESYAKDIYQSWSTNGTLASFDQYDTACIRGDQNGLFFLMAKSLK